MPAFDLNILAGQVILTTFFGAPAVALVAIAAFIVAAAPSFHSIRSRLALGGALPAVAAVILSTPWHDIWALPFGGMLVGLCIRTATRGAGGALYATTPT